MLPRVVRTVFRHQRTLAGALLTLVSDWARADGPGLQHFPLSLKQASAAGLNISDDGLAIHLTQSVPNHSERLARSSNGGYGSIQALELSFNSTGVELAGCVTLGGLARQRKF